MVKEAHNIYNTSNAENMQSDGILLWLVFCAAVLLFDPPQLVFGGSVETPSCGEYFGHFPQKFNINRRWGQVVGDEIDSVNDTAVAEDRPLNEFIVNLALLLPSADGEGCEDCLLRPVLPVIELAMVRAQEMLNEFMMENMDREQNRTLIRFRRLYGDTKCSSTIGPLVAVEMVTKSRPGKNSIDQKCIALNI